MTYEEQKREYLCRFEDFLEAYFENKKDNCEKILLDSMKYSIISGGKRVRPLMMLGMYELCGGKDDYIYRFAAAVEMIHTYSLIHDDLPCMDNDVFRRNKKCNHIIFGESVALLAGDALLTEAFECASVLAGDVDPIRAMQAVNILANCAGTSGMISGQTADLNLDNLRKDKNSLLKMYKNKTAMLISAAAKIGAVLSGATKEIVLKAAMFGEKIGLCFQLIDDVLDHERVNLDIIGGVQKTMEMIKVFTQEAKGYLNDIGKDTNFLSELADRLSLRIN